MGIARRRSSHVGAAACLLFSACLGDPTPLVPDEPVTTTPAALSGGPLRESWTTSLPSVVPTLDPLAIASDGSVHVLASNLDASNNRDVKLYRLAATGEILDQKPTRQLVGQDGEFYAGLAWNGTSLVISGEHASGAFWPKIIAELTPLGVVERWRYGAYGGSGGSTGVTIVYELDTSAESNVLVASGTLSRIDFQALDYTNNGGGAPIFDATLQPDDDVVFGQNGPRVLRLSSTGTNIEWDQTFAPTIPPCPGASEANTVNVVVAVESTPTDHVWAVERATSSACDAPGDKTTWLRALRLDAQGTLVGEAEWHPVDAWQIFHGADDAGNLYLATEVTIAPGETELRIARFSPTFSGPVWERSLRPTSDLRQELRGMTVSSDGKMILYGGGQSGDGTTEGFITMLRPSDGTSYGSKIEHDSIFVRAELDEDETALIAVRQVGLMPAAHTRVTHYQLDRDGDGLPDAWEEHGVPYGPGNGKLDLAALGCSPDRKDVLLEIDMMAGVQDEIFDAVFNVVAAFANAPVDNPDGSTGVEIHVINMFDEISPDSPIWTNTNADYMEFKDTWFGTALQRECCHRRAWVPVPPASPVPRDPPGGARTVLRLGRGAATRARVRLRIGEAVRGRRGRSVGTRGGQVEFFVGRYPFPSRMKRSERSVKRSAMICALSASGNTLGQSLNRRFVVMEVERRYS